MKRHPVVVASVIALTLMTAACSNKSGGQTGGGSSPAGAPSATQTSAGGSTSGGGTSGAGTPATAIVAQGFAFSPSSVTVSAGKVTLTVTNKDSVEHTFTLDDGSSSTNLAPGKTVTITLDLSKTVGWHCAIHPSMTGTLTVG